MNFNIFMLLSALMFFAFGTLSHAQNHKLKSVKVEIVNFSIQTFADVSCDDFGYTFKNEKKSKVFNAGPDLLKFQLLKKDFKSANTSTIDVRGSIVFSQGKINVKYCFDTFGYFYNDGKLYFNKKLLIYILDKMYTYRHPKYLDTLRQQ